MVSRSCSTGPDNYKFMCVSHGIGRDVKQNLTPSRVCGSELEGITGNFSVYLGYDCWCPA